MCGICGRVSPRGVAGAEIERMLARLAHRGPDDTGRFLGGEAGLGHQRLSIIDLDGGHQPIANEDESLWLVCNGEIYNHRALREELEQKGHRFRSATDSEVILHLYEEEGAACVSRLRGMFAFALWDVARKQLFAARDPLGQKPFFYSESGGAAGHELAFASEIKALLALDPALADPDPEAFDQYLALRVVLPPRTMFRRIRKLPPAHWLRFDAERGVETGRYWDLDYGSKHWVPTRK